MRINAINLINFKLKKEELKDSNKNEKETVQSNKEIENNVSIDTFVKSATESTPNSDENKSDKSKSIH